MTISRNSTFEIEWLYFYHVLPETVNMEKNTYKIFNKNIKHIYQMLIYYPCLKNSNNIKYSEYEIDEDDVALLSSKKINKIFKKLKKTKNLFSDLKNLTNLDNKNIEKIKISKEEKNNTIFKCIPLNFIPDKNKFIIGVMCYNNHKIPKIMNITKKIKYQFLNNVKLELDEERNIQTKKINIFKNISNNLSFKPIHIENISILDIINIISKYYSALEIEYRRDLKSNKFGFLKNRLKIKN
jgi:hypothetical protein